MTVLVTGGTGSIGLAVAEALCETGREVLLHGARAPHSQILTGWPANQHPTIVIGDVRDRSSLVRLMRDHDVSAVVHGAAATPDLTAERTSATDVLDINCVGALQSLLAAAEAKVGTFLFLGSIAAYGASATTEEVLAEDITPDRPVNIYEISKSAAEKAVRRVGTLVGINMVSLRLGDIFGRWEHQTGTRQVTSAIHQVTVHANKRTHSRLPRPGRKPWTYSRDVGRAVVQLVEKDAFNFETINLASPFTWSAEEWCQKLEQAFPGYSYELGHLERNVTMYADNAPMTGERLEQQLGGWRPEYGLEEAFDDYLSWLTSTGSWSLGEARDETASGRYT